jgi:hypothetical protein
MTEEIFEAEWVTGDDDANPNGTPPPREVAVWRQPPTVPDLVDGWVEKAAAVFRLADRIADTDFVPGKINRDGSMTGLRGSPAAVAACILTGRELGIGPMASLKHVQVVRGTPSLSAEFKRARALAAGHEIRIVQRDSNACILEGRRRGQRDWVTFRYTLDDAKRAGLLRGGESAWATRPRRMLFARASSELCDALFPDTTNGLPTTELIAEGEFDEFAGYDEPPSSTPDEREKAGRTRQRKTPARPEPNPAPEPEPPAAGVAVDVAGPEPEPAPAPAPEPEPEPKAKPKAKRNARDAIMRSFRDAGLDADDKAAHRHSAMTAIVGREITSADDLTDDEQSTVADTLAECIAIAKAGVLEIPKGYRKKDDLQRIAFDVIRELVTASRQTEARPEVEDPPFPEDFPDTPLPTNDQD